MITLDTSGIGAIFDRRDARHTSAVQALRDDRGPYVIPAQIMAEIAWFIETRFGQRVLGEFLDDVETGQYRLDCGEDDIGRVRDLVLKYSDMPLGFADAAVIACAERHGGKVLTLDHRHFGVVARDTAITILP